MALESVYQRAHLPTPDRRPCERRDLYRVIYRKGTLVDVLRKTKAGGYGSLRSQGRQQSFFHPLVIVSP
jgi:hypothetical protein